MPRFAMIVVLLTITRMVAAAQPPTVVLQAGLGDDHESWRTVAPAIAAQARVFAYDRPGYGRRAPTEDVRDPCTIAAELRQALLNAGLAPPYILVGHSFGGLYQYVFAKLYPKDVAGILLMDPTHPDHWRRMQHDAPATAVFMKVMRAVAFSNVMRAEFDDQARCLERIDTQRPLAIPARLLVRTQFGLMESGAFATMVGLLASNWQRLLGIRTAHHVAGAGHYIHHDRPGDVVAELQAVIGEVRARENVNRVLPANVKRDSLFFGNNGSKWVSRP